MTLCTLAAAAEKAYDVPPAMRPLPVASNRPMGEGNALYVDVAKGNDSAAGSAQAPFKSIKHAASKLKPGDTLYLRAGTYYEQPSMTLVGEPNKPITIRAYPNELVIIDGGLREFLDDPQSAWVPAEGGIEGEFWSAKTYEAQGDTRVVNTPGGVNVQGHFADTMVPLHGYWNIGDLRSTNEFWALAKKSSKEKETADTGDEPTTIYCGPGILYDPATKRIHFRGAHTTLKGVGDDNYRGESDPRKLKLIVSRPGRGSVLDISDSQHVRLQDLVLRGSRGSTMQVTDSKDITLDGMTIYAGQNCVQASYTRGMKMINSAFRGIAAPWTFRSSLKYRSIEARVIAASGWQPSGNSDFELSHSEFTDSVDGIFIGSIKNVQFHHNYVDNFSDDCLFLTAGTGYDGVTPGGNIHIYQNYFSRCLTMLAFGVGHGRQKLTPEGRQTGAGVWIYRNVFDNRKWVPYFQHKTAEDYEFEPQGRMSGDHGSPTWEPMYIYHNTIIAGSMSFRDFYLNGLSGGMAKGTKRRLFNNIVVQMKGLPGTVFPDASAELETKHNLHWNPIEGPAYQGDFFGKFRSGRIFKESQTLHSPGWTIGDLFADPAFIQLTDNTSERSDLRLQPTSAAVNAGTQIPAEWPDALRDKDSDKPDLGAIPAGVEAWPVGIGTRNTIAGAVR